MALESFDWDPNRIRDITRDNVLITQHEGGSEQRRKKFPKRRRFRLWFNRDRDVADDIYDFYKNREGRLESFNFTPPGAEEAIEVRFDSEFTESNAGGLVYELGFDLIEVL